MDVQLIQEDTVPALVARMAVDFQKKISATLQTQERFTWVLSGGHTPQQLYEALAKPPYLSRIPWDRLFIFWGDERPVPPTHKDSNFRMAQEALLRHVPLLPGHIFRLKGELPPAEAARDYENQLRTVFGSPPAFPAFDLVLLGMGPDGHTASLFPGTPALAVKDRWVVDNPVASLQTVRLTLTLPVLNHAHAVWFLATGADKANVFSHVRAAPNIAYPASLVSPPQGNVRWYVDNTITQRS